MTRIRVEKQKTHHRFSIFEAKLQRIGDAHAALHTGPIKVQGPGIAEFQDKGFSERVIPHARTAGQIADATYLIVRGQIRFREKIGRVVFAETRCAPTAEQGVIDAGGTSTGQDDTGGWRPCRYPALKRSKTASKSSYRSFCSVLKSVALRADFVAQRTIYVVVQGLTWRCPWKGCRWIVWVPKRGSAPFLHRRNGHQGIGIAPVGRALGRCQRLVLRNSFRHAFTLGQPLRGMTARFRNGFMDFLQIR